MRQLKRSDKETDGEDLLYKFWELINRGEPIPKEVLETLSDKPSLSFHLIMNLFKKGKVSSIKDIPIEMIKSAAKVPEGARYLAALINFKGKDVPDELIQSILKDLEYSYKFAIDLLKSGKDIPDEIIQGISKNSEYSYNIAMELLKPGKDIPDKIIQSISEDS